MHRPLSYLLVLLQFGLLFGLIFIGGVFGTPLAIVAVVLALLLGAWAIIAMHFSVSVLPDVRESQELIQAGPYKYIRHPMYTAVLLIGVAPVINKHSVLVYALWLALLVVLVIKLQYEERQLSAKFSTYKTYMSHTKRLVPFLY